MTTASRFIADNIPQRKVRTTRPRAKNPGSTKVGDLVDAILAGRTRPDGTVEGIPGTRRPCLKRMQLERGRLGREVAGRLVAAGHLDCDGSIPAQVGRRNIGPGGVAFVADAYGFDASTVLRKIVGGEASQAITASRRAVEARASVDPNSVEGRVIRYIQGLDPAEVLTGSATGQEVFERVNKQLWVDLFVGRTARQFIKDNFGRYRTVRARIPGIVGDASDIDEERTLDLRRFVRHEIRRFTDRVQAIRREFGPVGCGNPSEARGLAVRSIHDAATFDDGHDDEEPGAEAFVPTSDWADADDSPGVIPQGDRTAPISLGLRSRLRQHA